MGVMSVIDLLDEIMGSMRAANAATTPILESVTVNPLGSFDLTGENPGLIEGATASFANPLALTFRGRVVIGPAAVDPMPITLLGIRMVVRTPSGATLAEGSSRAEPDGRTEVSLNIDFGSRVVPATLTCLASVTGAGSRPTLDQYITLDNARLEWFLNVFDRLEGQIPVTTADRMNFVAAVRRVLLPSSSFDNVLRKATPMPGLPPPKTVGSRWKAADGAGVWADDRLVRLSHVLIGIEAARGRGRQRMLPSKLSGFQPVLDGIIVELVSWAGDLGGAIRTFLFQHYFAQLANKKKDYDKFEDYLDHAASSDQLVGDIDGVNLASTFDVTKSLATNLRTYYTTTSTHRYTEFLQHQVDRDGQRYLFRDPVGSATITPESKKAIPGVIASTAELLLAASIFEATKPSSDMTTVPYPLDVVTALNPNSAEVRKSAEKFITFLEDGLASEP